MKKIFYLSFLAFLFSCSNQSNVNNVVQVSLPAEGVNFISWLDVFQDIEMIKTSGNNAPLFDHHCRFIANNENFYVIDQSLGPDQDQKIHRFNKNGKYLNSIGVMGRGPKEYLNITDMIVDNDGNVSIFSQPENKLLTYSPTGEFLNSRELPYPTERFISHEGFNYHYIGAASYTKDYKLYVTNDSGQEVGHFFPSPKAPSLPNRNTFALNNQALYLSPNEGSYVYQLENGGIKDTVYNFDFGEYNIPQEYYEHDNFLSLINFLEGKTIATKFEFSENKDCAIFIGMRQTGIEAFNPFCGILDKKRNLWKWFNVGIGDSYTFLPYLWGDSIYFIADIEILKEYPEMKEHFPVLNTMDDNSGMVFLKAKTRNISL